MTVLVSVEGVQGMLRLRRYEAETPRTKRCTHEGFYEPESVSPAGVSAYSGHGAPQDRVERQQFLAAAGARPA
jgi:hypothetical protein